jgi:hypothetical protein
VKWSKNLCELAIENGHILHLEKCTKELQFMEKVGEGLNVKEGRDLPEQSQKRSVFRHVAGNHFAHSTVAAGEEGKCQCTCKVCAGRE